MVNFHCKDLKSKYGKNASLIYSDTDSLLYVVITDDVYKDMIKDNDMFGFFRLPQRPQIMQNEYCW